MEERTHITRFNPVKTKPEDNKKIPENKFPSPVSYDVDGSFKSTQLIRPRFFIPKGKIISLAMQASKQKSFVPPPGSYNMDSAYDKITKGASSGWK